MPSLFSIEWMAGLMPIRAAVDRAFLNYAQTRVTTLQKADPFKIQKRTLKKLLAKARLTTFGRDHDFGSLRTIGDYQSAVPVRTYEQLWDDYLRDSYPLFDNLTWPGLLPFLALTSGTTRGATKYIPLSRAMLASNLAAARTMMAFQVASYPESRLFRGKHLFLGGSTALENPAPGVFQGDLSGIVARELSAFARPYTFPPLDIALEPSWDRKLKVLAESSPDEPITVVSGVPSWLLTLFERLLQSTGKSTVAEVWPSLEVVVHGGVRFDPYRSAFRELLGNDSIRLQESYPCSEGFVAYGDLQSRLLRLCFDHGIFYEFVPVGELDTARPTRHWLGNVQKGVNYAIVLTTCAGMWSHVVGDTVRFESLDPPLIAFTGRTRYGISAFGEHLLSEEVEAAIAAAAESAGGSVRDWHMGPVFQGTCGFHRIVCEFFRVPHDLEAFRNAIDAELSRRNADYRAHRADRAGILLPAILIAKAGGLDDWMRSRGKSGGQHKLPRMDGSGLLTLEIVEHLRSTDQVVQELEADDVRASV